MMCEAAHSISTLTIPTCPDGDFIIGYSSSGDEVGDDYFSSLNSIQHPKVAITLADYSSDIEDNAETSEMHNDQQPKFHLPIPSIMTTNTEADSSDDDDFSQVDQRYLHAAETTVPADKHLGSKEKFITRLRRSASFTSPYKSCRRLSQDCNTNNERKPTLLTRTLSFIKNKIEFASTSTLYPSKEEIRQWQHSFDGLLHHKYGCLIFRDFLKTEFSVENIDFWLECEEFKKMKEGKKATVQKAQCIYKQYIEVDSPNEINIDGEVRIATKTALDGGAKPNTFSLAQSQIEQLMEKDSYSRFVRSENFQKLLLN